MAKIEIALEPGFIEFLITCVNSVNFHGAANALKVVEADKVLRDALTAQDRCKSDA